MCADSISFMIPSSYEHYSASYYTYNTDPDLTLKLINDYYHRRAGQHDIVGSINYSLYRKNASNKGAIEYVIGNEGFQKRTTAKGLEVYWKGDDSIHVYTFTKNYIIELYFRDDEPSINQAIFETVDYN